MTTVIRRRGAAAAALTAVLGLVLSSCASGPSQVNAAAIIDGEVISVGQVQELVAQAQRAEPATAVLATQRKLPYLSRGVLEKLINHRLIEAYQKRTPVTIDESLVAQGADRLAATTDQLPADGAGVPVEAIVNNAVTKSFPAQEQIRDLLLLNAIGSSRNTQQVTVDLVAFDDAAASSEGTARDRAMAKANQLAALTTAEADALIQKESAENRAKAQQQDASGQPVTVPLWQTGATFSSGDAEQVPDAIVNTPLFGSAPGSVVVFKYDQPSQSGETSTVWYLGVIKAVKDGPKVSAGQAANAFSARNVAFGQRALHSVVNDFGLELSPRYGVFDRATLSIAPSEGETNGAVLHLKDAKTP
ncbi:hypothetical protein [Actinokineospora bangkokensis]|uniref:PpiC domain-containing protein n=1 Tax=Actinokineospora bangkokensis TaxID=1193682 RepID=A0A1Q9LDB5_9PSEU|nr:hypothetical protein [Actinokineospora bangkokensis]OLR89995.1 hypothetical protein BJP25_03165 [Actinokineospora bangkokensis]